MSIVSLTPTALTSIHWSLTSILCTGNVVQRFAVVLDTKKIMKKVDDLSDLFSSDEDVAAYNIDNMIDTFNQLQQSLLGEEFIDFGDL